MDGRKQLALAFSDHVRIMGWSQEDVAGLGGPSTTTQTKITQTDESISMQTCKKIDVVMGWPPGTAHRVQQGVIHPPKPLTSDMDANKVPRRDRPPSGFGYEWKLGRTVPAGQIDISVGFTAQPGLKVDYDAITHDMEAPVRDLMDAVVVSVTRNGGQQDAGTAEAQKNDDGDDGEADEPTPIRRDIPAWAEQRASDNRHHEGRRKKADEDDEGPA